MYQHGCEFVTIGKNVLLTHRYNKNTLFTNFIGNHEFTINWF